MKIKSLMKSETFISFLIVIILPIFIFIYNYNDTSHPILSKKGLNNVISITNKIKRYNSWFANGVTVRIPIVGVPILWGIKWMFEPSKKEYKYFGQYIYILKYLVEELNKDGKICNAPQYWFDSSNPQYWFKSIDINKLIEEIFIINKEVHQAIDLNIIKDELTEDVISSALYLILYQIYNCEKNVNM